MKRAIVYLVLTFLFFQGSLLAYSSNPKEFVNELVKEAIDKLADKNLNKSGNFINNLDIKNLIILFVYFIDIYKL